VIRWINQGLVVSLVLGILLDRIFGRVIRLDPEAIREWFDQLGAWAPVVYIGAMIGAIVFSPIPSLPLDIAAGLAFGLFRGTVYTLIGAEIGAIIAFLIARRIGRPRLAARLSPSTMQQIDDISERMGVRAIILMRLIPLFNFDWVSYAAGLTSMSLARFAVATLIGMTPTVIAITAVGSNATTNPSVSIAIFGGLMLLFVAPIVVAAVRSLRNRRSSVEEPHA
jgi:uncharacterized membrane protein YdjX (TVP38/TMEM64 family)